MVDNLTFWASKLDSCVLTTKSSAVSAASNNMPFNRGVYSPVPLLCLDYDFVFLSLSCLLMGISERDSV